MYRIYTRTGDKGTTALFGGSRIDKDDIRVEAYGTVDELISQLGVCYASTHQTGLRQDLYAIQKMLFVLGAELASDEKGLARLQQRIGDEDIQALEQLIDRNMAQSGPLKEFVIPGKNLPSAQLHVARTLTRRLERLLIAMSRTLTLHDEPRRYINRLSDALFSMARIEETSPDACA
ncbi:cob(I)yrinic acid a,c-diamide adenosyltransferase [Citrobacter portucalensis]|uniref:cob(I)yrinic acid a,c-diamide adenosyltransferase n=1 Tax=Citrobacter portucalensis TaxID=1639133 RepID=UPI0038909F67